MVYFLWRPSSTTTCGKRSIGQALFQLAVTLVLAFAGTRIFTDWTVSALNTIVFNSYVWMQIFNQINCRRIDNNFNVFTGMHRNPLFLVITLITVGGQILIIYVGGTAFSVTRLNGVQWVVCIAVLGLLSLPFGAVMRLVPNYSIPWFSRRSDLNVEETVAPEGNQTVAEAEVMDTEQKIYPGSGKVSSSLMTLADLTMILENLFFTHRRSVCFDVLRGIFLRMTTLMLF